MKYDLSELLKNYRIKYEITQQEAAKRIGISQPTVVKIENGGEPTVLIQGKILKEVLKDGEQSIF